MPGKLWRRVAGSLAIELLLAAGLTAADFEYKAGTAQTGRVQALALADRRGRVAVIAQADFAIPQTIADMVAVEVMKAHRMERGDVLIRSRGPGKANPRELLDTMEAALGALEPARLLFDGTRVSAFTGGACRAVLSHDGSLEFERCAEGRVLRGTIRSAFQVAEPEHGLLLRGETPPSFTVQVLALGKDFTIVSARAADGSPSKDPGVEAAIRRVLARVR